MYFTIVKQVVFEVNLVFSPRTHKCRVGACIGTMAWHALLRPKFGRWSVVEVEVDSFR